MGGVVNYIPDGDQLKLQGEREVMQQLAAILNLQLQYEDERPTLRIASTQLHSIEKQTRSFDISIVSGAG